MKHARSATILLLAVLATLAAPSVAAAEADATAKVACVDAGLPQVVCDLIDQICDLIDKVADRLREVLPASLWAVLAPVIDVVKDLCRDLH